jgi:hypothetical protein
MNIAEIEKYSADTKKWSVLRKRHAFILEIEKRGLHNSRPFSV